MVGDPVSEHGELAVERVIHADNLFPYVGGHVVAADESGSTSRLRENTSVRPPRDQQRRRIGIDQASRNRVVGEWLPGYYVGRQSTLAIRSEVCNSGWNHNVQRLSVIRGRHNRIARRLRI